MAMMKIRGEQIRDNQIEDRHIKTKLTEAVLDIDFTSHSSEILDKKLVMDYVQRNDIVISSTTSTITFTTATPPATDDSQKGIILNKYTVKVRNSSTGEPVLYTDSTPDPDEEKPVYAKITTHNGPVDGDYTYTVSFFVSDGSGGDLSASVPSGLTLDLLYPQRFSLDDVNEAFASNEKFVDAAADVTSHLNIRQLASELFGSNYKLNNTGDLSDPFSNGNTLVEQISKETHGVINDTVSAKTTIDEVIEARGSGNSSLNERLSDISQSIIDKDAQVRQDLANETDASKGANMVHVKLDSSVSQGLKLTSNNATVQTAMDGLYQMIVNDSQEIYNDLASTTDVSKGASLVGVHDASGVFDADNVENVLKELYDKIVADVQTESSSRISADNALSGRLGAVESTLDSAKGQKNNVDERLDVSLDEYGRIKEYTTFHKHSTKSKTVGQDQSTVTFVFGGADQYDKPKNTDKFDVYINGLKQSLTENYSVTVNEGEMKVVIDFGLSSVYQNDLVTLESTIYATPQE